MSSLRRALWILAPILLLLVVVSRTAELRTLERIFSGADPRWLLAALLLQVAFAVNQGAFYQAIFRLLDTRVSLGTAVWLSLTTAFVSMASPAGTVTGVAYFVMAARTRNVPPARAFWTSLIYYFFDYSAFLVVLVVGLLVLLLRRDLHAAQFVVIAAFYAVVLLIAVVAIRVVSRPAVIPRLLAFLTGIVDRVSLRLRGRPAFSAGRAIVWAGDLQEVIASVRGSPRRAARPFVHALVVEALGLGTLAVVFRAIGAPLHPGVLVAGYAIGVFFMVASVTPSGVGVMEGAMIVTFTSLFVPLEAAVAGALLFRLFTFWLPLAAGFVTLHVIPRAR